MFLYRYGKGSFDFGRMIKAVTGHFNTEEMKNEVCMANQPSLSDTLSRLQ